MKNKKIMRNLLVQSESRNHQLRYLREFSMKENGSEKLGMVSENLDNQMENLSIKVKSRIIKHMGKESQLNY
jgi:hypothetical protein